MEFPAGVRRVRDFVT